MVRPGISHVVEELKCREDLREFLRIFDLNSFIAVILRILNSITKKRARNTKLIVDCTDVSVDINWFRKACKAEGFGGKRLWRGKDYRWGYSTRGMSVRMKLTLVLEHPCKPLLFLLHPANRHEAKIFSGGDG